MEWEKYRKADGSINLNLAFEVECEDSDTANWDTGYDFLARVVTLQPIVSRQAAAIALATAESLSRLFLEE